MKLSEGVEEGGRSTPPLPKKNFSNIILHNNNLYSVHSAVLKQAFEIEGFKSVKVFDKTLTA